MALTLPDLIFEISYGTNAWDPPTWVDETGYLRSFKCRSGKQHELNQVDAATSILILLNNDRRFDPTWLAGPHGGQLLPGVRFRLRATWAGITYPILHQWAERWTPQWPRPASSDTELTGVDSFKRLRKKKITSAGYQPVVVAQAPLAFYRLGDAPGSAVAKDSSGNGRDGAYVGTPTLGVTSLLVAESDSAMDGNTGKGAVSIPAAACPTGTGAFSIKGWFKTDQNNASADIIYDQSSAPPSAAPTGACEIGLYVFNGKVTALLHDGFSLQGPTVKSDNLPHQAVLTRAAGGTAVKLYVDGSQVDAGTDIVFNVGNNGVQAMIGGDPTGDLATNAGPSWTGVLDEVATYNAELTAAQILADFNQGQGAWANQLSGARIGVVLDTIGWPSADRDIDAGSSLLQAVKESLATVGSLDHMQLVEKSEAGLFFQGPDGKIVFRSRFSLLQPPYTSSQATFGDGPGELPYQPAPEAWLGDDDIYSEALGKRVGGSLQRAFDQPSNDQFGPSSYSFPDLLLADDAEVNDRMEWLVSHYRLPAPRIGKLRVRPLNDPANIFPVVLGLYQGARVTVNRRPPGGGAVFSQAGIIESIGHEKTEEGDWIFEAEIGAADYADYWILGTSQLGINTRLAY